MDEVYIGERKDSHGLAAAPGRSAARGRVPVAPDGQARRQGRGGQGGGRHRGRRAGRPRRPRARVLDRPARRRPCRSTTASTAPGAASAWRSTAAASRSRTATARQGLYFVRYVDPAFAGKEEPGFFSQAVQLRQEGRRQRPGQVPRQGQRRRQRQQHRRRARLAGQARNRRSRQADRRPAARRPEVSGPARRHGERVIRFCSLGSGSSGNATVVEATSGITTTRLLIDAGFSLRELETAAGARRPRGLDDLDAVFVTHEHGDHIGCALALAERQRPAAVDEPRHLARDRRARARRRRCASPATASRSRSATSSCTRSPSPTTPPSRCSCAAATAPRGSACSPTSARSPRTCSTTSPAATRCCSSATTTRRCSRARAIRRR